MTRPSTLRAAGAWLRLVLLTAAALIGVVLAALAGAEVWE